MKGRCPRCGGPILVMKGYRYEKGICVWENRVLWIQEGI